MKNRPVGVAIIAILLIVEAIIQILASLGFFGLSIAEMFEHLFTGALAAEAGLALGSILLVLGLVELIVAVGLWEMERWAWLVTAIVLWMDVIFDVLVGFVGGETFATTIWSMLIPVVVLIYLYQVHVRKAFNR